MTVSNSAVHVYDEEAERDTGPHVLIVVRRLDERFVDKGWIRARVYGLRLERVYEGFMGPHLAAIIVKIVWFS